MGYWQGAAREGARVSTLGEWNMSPGRKSALPVYFTRQPGPARAGEQMG